MSWITDWSEIGNDTLYLIQPVNGRPDGTLYLGSPPAVLHGWQVKRLMKGCYAALELPDPASALRQLREANRRIVEGRE